MRRNLWIVGLVIIVVVGYLLVLKDSVRPSNKSAPPSPTTVNEQKETFPEGTYKGTLPCADCPGLETELTFSNYNQGASEGNYTLKETYLEKSVEPMITKGTWTILKSPKREGVVYALRSDTGDPEIYYLKLNNTQIKTLDNNQQEINAPFNYILTKVK